LEILLQYVGPVYCTARSVMRGVYQSC